MGKVYSGMCRSTGNRVALKFFGYTLQTPTENDIINEIQVMSLLAGTDGIVQLYGVFMDTSEGYIDGKHFKEPHPVIVMELVEGGELSDRIYNRKCVSESYLAKMFKRVIRAMECLHKRRCIHRDIKLENIMLVGYEEDSPVKFIDFGLMVQLPEGSSEHLCYTLKGTNGCFAPESIISSIYSEKTDIWQAGCTLYSMLSGLAPYDPSAMHQITHGTYFDMTGIGWDNISDAAKDLVRRILTKDPSQRATIDEILHHPWLVDQAPDDDLGEEYVTRIKQLALRQKLRTFFLDHKIASDNLNRRENLHKVLPFLRERGDSSLDGDVNVEQSFNFKLHNLKQMIVKTVSRPQMSSPTPFHSKSSPHHPAKNSHSNIREARKGNLFSRRWSQEEVRTNVGKHEQVRRGLGEKSKSERNGIHEDMDTAEGEINYATFVEILLQCGLPELANPAVFTIFDIGNSGTINIKEFLLAMLAFKPITCDPLEDSNARLYFQIFDINDTGYIDLEELKMVVACLLQASPVEAAPRDVLGISENKTSIPDIEALFEAMDTEKSGRIDFQQFKTFYDTVLHHTTLRANAHNGDSI